MTHEEVKKFVAEKDALIMKGKVHPLWAEYEPQMSRIAENVWLYRVFGYSFKNSYVAWKRREKSRGMCASPPSLTPRSHPFPNLYRMGIEFNFYPKIKTTLMTKIYITRHGQDRDNANNILNGHRDMPLTEIGMDQAGQLA